jgi:hypothetical protein
VGPRDGLNAVTKRKIPYHCPSREFNPGRSARSLATTLGTSAWEMLNKRFIYFLLLSSSGIMN